MFVLLKSLPITPERPYRQWQPVRWWLVEDHAAEAADALELLIDDLPDDDGAVYQVAQVRPWLPFVGTAAGTWAADQVRAAAVDDGPAAA